MAGTREIPSRAQKLVVQETHGVCALCEEREVSTLEFHHIDGRDGPDPHRAENLIYVCRNCHGKITAGVISRAEVAFRKRTLGGAARLQTSKGTPNNTITMSGVTNAGIIANEVHFHDPRRLKTSAPMLPEGAIGSELLKRNYLKYLIDRYHEFAGAHRDGYKHQVFYATIKREFGSKWDLIPVERFERVCHYVQGRIDKTRLGKTRRAQGQKNFSRFEEFREKHS